MTYLNESTQPSQKDQKFVHELSEPAKPHFNWARTLADFNEADLSHGVTIQYDFIRTIIAK